MGIKNFFGWFKKHFSSSIYNLKTGQNFSTLQPKVCIDNLMIDMNGLFHTSAQKIYEYGNYKPKTRLLGSRKFTKRIGGFKKQLEVFEDVCNTLDKVLEIVKPNKRLILCVDGPAPLSKQNQQRQRRFLSSVNNTDQEFDSNSITPGTKFMNNLTKYIDWNIRKKMSESPSGSIHSASSANASTWSNIEVIFSNEKAPGEGEHKLINYIRKFGNKNESYCIHGMDADLIMLSLGTHFPKFYILREEPMREFEFYVINIGEVRKELADMMKWSGSSNFVKEYAINDFIFMCFTVGNDFLPHIPGIEIIEGGIDFMLDVYKNVCKEYGHITKNTKKGVRFHRKSLKHFLGTISQYEKGVLENKLLHKDTFFQDVILENNSSFEHGNYIVDIDEYRNDYYSQNFSKELNIKSLCHSYLEGMQWVMTYYTQGVPDWKWRFPYHYAPFSYTISKYISSFSFKDYSVSSPTVPFVQLLSVLPPKSCNLLPVPLDKTLVEDMEKYCPENFEVDLSGKKYEWEGTVILPMVDYEDVEEIYFNTINKVDIKDRKRNILGRSFIYSKSQKSYDFRSFYGDFICRVTTEPIDL